jgi:GTP cyclohydrolase I
MTAISSESQLALRDVLPDHANEADARGLAIDRVGIKDLTYPIQILDRQQEVQHTVANISLYVDLPKHFKGTHMSRFIEVLNGNRGELTIRQMPNLLGEISRRLEAKNAFAEIRFPYFISKKAPVSGVESLMDYACAFIASAEGTEQDFMLEVVVPVKSLCPCSKSISERGAHNQRSAVTVRVRSTDFLWIEDVVSAVEGCASAPLFALLKREDEKYITELAYDNPKFVEDLVRDAVLEIRKLDGVNWLHVSAENFESIHNHSAYAEIEWKVDEEDKASQASLELVSTGEPVEAADSFGLWVREMRTARRYSQQDLADRLEVSASYLSKVESDTKALSQEALLRLADVLGTDPDLIQLRAGILPPRVQDQIVRNPEALLQWAAERSTS